jgi:hypothetical protein
MPIVPLSVMQEYFERCSKANPDKHFTEGINRAHDGGAAMVDGGTIAYRSDLKQCLIQMSVPQSQGRHPNTPNLIFDLDSSLSTATKVAKAVCTCYRKSNDIVCKHKGGCGMCCVICAAMGGAGDPVSRKRYWEGQAGQIGGTQAATRTVHLVTDRTSQVKVEDIRKLEESPQALPPQGTKRKAAGSTLPALKKRVTDLYKEHVRIDASKLKEIEIRHNIMRYTRECMFKC